MDVSFSVKNVPQAIAERLRLRAERNHRSLQGELLAILETAACEELTSLAPLAEVRGSRSVEDTLQRLRTLHPKAVKSEVPSSLLTRQMRDRRYGKSGKQGA